MIPKNGILNKYQRFRNLSNTDIDIKTGITKVGRKYRDENISIYTIKQYLKNTV
jgi:hypothetical protein